MKPQGSQRVLLLLFPPQKKLPPLKKKIFSEVAVLKFRKIPLDTPAVDFYFSCKE